MIKLDHRTRALLAEAEAHYEAGRLSEAEAAYRAALAISPDYALTAFNLGVVIAAQGNHKRAIDYFEKAIAAEPDYAAAHHSLGLTYLARGRIPEAIGALRRACALAPDDYDAHRALGFLWLAQGNRDRALDHFARTYELRRGEDRIGLSAGSLNSTTRIKLLHDAQQFRYLSQQGRNRNFFEALARHYERAAQEASDAVAALTARQSELLGESYNTAIHLRDAAEIATGALGPRPDRDAIIRSFTGSGRGIVFFDNLLTSPALLDLRRYLLECTIWHDFSHIEGFVASYLEDGLACPLLLQIADEIRAAFPELLRAHPLSQAWAFKAVEPRAAIEAHADDAAISVNFWTTPTEANLTTRQGGGLQVCPIRPPSDWMMTDYRGDRDRIVTFLEQHAAESITVPYRENRAVIFESRLFHRSDVPEFAPDYESHRINITLLFGRR